jgi:secretion/DNA translocation related CpaE-like protein
MDPAPTAAVIGVVGGCGGAGATSLAAALAAGAANAVLIDLDAIGGGIDVMLGAENADGPRWSRLHASGDRLDPNQLAEGLPRWAGVPFLACDSGAELAPGSVRSVVEAARCIGTVIVDLGRCPSPARSAALALTDVLVLVVPTEIRAVTAGAALRAGLEEDFTGQWRLVVRLDRPVLGPRRIAEVLGLELAGTVAVDRGLMTGRDRGIDPRRLRRDTVALCRALTACAVST